MKEIKERGIIRAEHWVYCGICNHMEFAEGNSKAAAVEQAKRRLGYKWTRRYGWLCSRCQEDLQEQSTANGK